jgi:undecaprenyl pyrophosphate phosphatase UppP
MKSKVQNSIKFLKRFFEPAFLDKTETSKAIFISLVNALYVDVMPLVSIPFLIKAIQNKDILSVYMVSLIVGICVLSYFAVRLTTFGWYWYSHRKYNYALEKK